MSSAIEKSAAHVTKAEYERLAAFRYNLRRFLRFSESAARSADLTSRQYQALLAIKGFPAGDGLTVGELAEQLQITHHSAVGLVNRLVLRNLVLRDAGIEDRRYVYVKLTTRGAEVLEKLASAHKEELVRLSSSFPK
jgi:DNA-binding MarR family transcriptional regulator